MNVQPILFSTAFLFNQIDFMFSRVTNYYLNFFFRYPFQHSVTPEKIFPPTLIYRKSYSQESD
jgi:hypothetical protein